MEVQVLEAGCVGCEKTGNGVLCLSTCAHSAHYACCCRVREPRRCPQCFVELSWLDHARGVGSRREFLQVMELSFGDVEFKALRPLELLDVAWNKHQQSGATRSSGPPKAKRSRQSSSSSSALYWGAGTGFGGSQTEGVNQSKAKLNLQTKTDQQLTKLLQALLPHQTDNEQVYRKSQLLPLAHSFLINGPADVANRHELYASLLEVLLALGKRPALAPLFVASGVEDGEAAAASSSLLVKLTRLGEALLDVHPALAAQCEDVRDAVVYCAAQHPHFIAKMSEIEASIKRVDRGKQRQTLQQATTLAVSSVTAGKPELEASYKSGLQSMAFRTTCLLDLCEHGTVSHSFVKQGMPQMPLRPGHNPKLRMQRIHSELATLKSSLTVEWNSSVFCIVDENRMDVLQFMIVGPEGTPYQNGCFLFDCLLPLDYPQAPPQVLIQTTGGGKVRFNPNLYKDGKVCLSLLNTWAGPSWDPKTSTLLQVLISIQSLIMVPDPYFNEPGMESQRGMEAQSQQYNAAVRYNCIRLAMYDMILHPPFAFDKICRTHFVLKKNEIKHQFQVWAREFAQHANAAALSYASQLPSSAVFNAECNKTLAALEQLGQQTLFAPLAAAAAVVNASIMLDEDQGEETTVMLLDDEEEDEVIVID
ncbi:hypothetical protein BASA81_003553 [Batrachochytrium salamandrivorans]|nr:hypothetical protein BASA81_003553 [Batrachochytrium salamandrivorans]